MWAVENTSTRPGGRATTSVSTAFKRSSSRFTEIAILIAKYHTVLREFLSCTMYPRALPLSCLRVSLVLPLSSSQKRGEVNTRPKMIQKKKQFRARIKVAKFKEQPSLAGMFYRDQGELDF